MLMNRERNSVPLPACWFYKRLSNNREKYQSCYVSQSVYLLESACSHQSFPCALLKSLLHTDIALMQWMSCSITSFFARNRPTLSISHAISLLWPAIENGKWESEIIVLFRNPSRFVVSFDEITILLGFTRKISHCTHLKLQLVCFTICKSNTHYFATLFRNCSLSPSAPLYLTSPSIFSPLSPFILLSRLLCLARDKDELRDHYLC